MNKKRRQPGFKLNETGAVAIVVAILMVALLGFTALVVDVGYMYSVRRQLQAAADGAALAGCQTLIKGGDQAAVLAEAKTYAEGDASGPYNNVKPGEGLSMVTTSPYTKVTDDYVKVTVEKTAQLFFARFLGQETQLIRAQAVAEKAYLTGMKGLVPWGVPIINADKVTAKIGSGTEVALSYNSSTKKWSGALDVPSGVTSTGVPVTVTAYNKQKLIWADGVPETIKPAGTVVVYDSASTVTDVYFDRNFIRSDTTTTIGLFVESTGVPKARFDNKNYNMSLVSGYTNLYKATLTVPNSDRVIDSYPVEVSVGNVKLSDAAMLLVRRSTYPIVDIKTSKTFFTGTGNTLTIAVELNDLVYGEPYDLKVTSGAESGNFAALDFCNVYHPPLFKNPDFSEGLGHDANDYYNFLDHRYEGVIHIGDVIWTKTGNLSGPTTRDHLLNRFAGDTTTFDQWNSADRPPSNRVVFVPIMEKIDITTGSSPLRVISFAAFYIEPGSDLKGDNIIGKFIEYLMPGEYSDTPPEYGLYLETARLTKKYLDF